MDRAIDTQTGREADASEAIRERYRYRCPHASCRGHVRPCRGDERQYFRHEPGEGSPDCPLRVEENSSRIGADADQRQQHLRRLILGETDDGWRLERTERQVVPLLCPLNEREVEAHPHIVEAIAPAQVQLFEQPRFGGMQLGETGVVYPGGLYFLLRPDHEDLPAALRPFALREGAPRPEGTLYRLRLPPRWTPELRFWVESVGFLASESPRFAWQLESDLQAPEVFSGNALGALLSAPQFEGHHVSVRMVSPTDATWEVKGWHEKNASRRGIFVTCRYRRRLGVELHIRVESDLPVHGIWEHGTWTDPAINASQERLRSFRVDVDNVDGGISIRGHVVVGWSEPSRAERRDAIPAPAFAHHGQPHRTAKGTPRTPRS